jgi:hypothetical protein
MYRPGLNIKPLQGSPKTIRVRARFEDIGSVVGWSGGRRKFILRSPLAARPRDYGEKPPKLRNRRLGAQDRPYRIAPRYHDQSLTYFPSSFHNQPPATLQVRSICLPITRSRYSTNLSGCHTGVICSRSHLPVRRIWRTGGDHYRYAKPRPVPRPMATSAPAARERDKLSSRNAAATGTGPSGTVNGPHPRIPRIRGENRRQEDGVPDPAGAMGGELAQGRHHIDHFAIGEVMQHLTDQLRAQPDSPDAIVIIGAKISLEKKVPL